MKERQHKKKHRATCKKEQDLEVTMGVKKIIQFLKLWTEFWEWVRIFQLKVEGA